MEVTSTTHQIEGQNVMFRVLLIFLCVCVIGTTNAQTNTPTSMHSRNLDVGQYSTEAEAKRACSSDQVVWEDTNTGVLHSLTDKYKDRKTGAYMCKSAALKDGMNMAK